MEEVINNWREDGEEGGGGRLEWDNNGLSYPCSPARTEVHPVILYVGDTDI